jgi:hypothetical protein
VGGQGAVAIACLALIGACEFVPGVLPDASVNPSADAPLDAGLDTPPDPDGNTCSNAGLTCTTGMLWTFSCGGGCWVGCKESTTHADAKARCIAWGGELARITDQATQDCVNGMFQTSTARWLGLEQAAAQTSPSAGWSWGGDGLALPFTTGWSGGQPNDGDGDESDHLEQCVYMSNPSGAWHDTPCTSPSGAFACTR